MRGFNTRALGTGKFQLSQFGVYIPLSMGPPEKGLLSVFSSSARADLHRGLLEMLIEKTQAAALILNSNNSIFEAIGSIPQILNQEKSKLLGKSLTQCLGLEGAQAEALLQILELKKSQNLRLKINESFVDLHFKFAEQKPTLVMVQLVFDAEKRFREMSQAAPFFIWLFEADGECHFLNRAWLEFRGRLNAPPSSWREALSAKDCFLFESSLNKAIRERKSFECELRVQRADGVYRWVLWRGVARFDDRELFTGFIVTGLDISAQKEIQQSLEKSSRNLLRSNQELEEFAYVASHDLQEPLRMISSFIDLLREEYSTSFDRTADEYMGFVQDAALRMRTLIQDLLTYSRVGHDPLQQSSFDLEEALKNAMTNLKPLIDANRALITWDDLPKVFGHQNQVTQVFQNLIENGVKYRGQDNPRIHISVQAKNSFWEVRIRDNGIGFDMKFHDRIFQIFQRLHARDQYAGTGLGLAITKKIVESYGGSLWAHSSPAAGAEFCFTIPESVKY